MEWFCAIRAAKQKVLQEKHPDWLADKVYYNKSHEIIVMHSTQIRENLSSDFIKCGYMQKTPSGTMRVCLLSSFAICACI